MNEVDQLKDLLEKEKLRNSSLTAELTKCKREIEEILNNSAYETYKTVIESANDIIFKVNTSGNFTYVNPAAEHTAGYEKDELIGMNFLAIIPDDHKQRVIENYSEQLRSKSTTSYIEFPFCKKTGELVWVGQSVQPILVDGNIVGFTAIARDITKRVRSQQQLNVANSRFESIVNNLNSGLLLEDENRMIIMTNQKFCEIFRYNMNPEQLVGMDCKAGLEASVGAFRNGRAQLDFFSSCVQNREICLGQEVPLSDGRILKCDYIPIFVDRVYTGHLWKYEDVTEQVNSRALLEQNEEKYRKIIQNMNLGLLVVDNDGNIEDSNPSFSDMTGYSREELIGKQALSILAVEGRKNIFEDVVGLRKKGVSSAYEVELKNKAGEKLWMQISGSPVFDAQNAIAGSIGIHLDITERKRQIIELNEAKKKAEDSMHSKEMFLANMSHEIRTPMNAIIGMTSLLKEMDMPLLQKEYLDAIKTSSENLLVIINDILDFSKIDHGKVVLDESVFSLHSIIGSLFLQFNLKAKDKGLSYTNRIDPGVNDLFYSDSGRIVQILTNLLSNSLKFTHEGRVELACELLKNSDDRQLIRFCVSDTGIGIDSEKQAIIFESFMQENSSVNKKYGGTGLGLSISRQLTRLFGSDLMVKSEKGKGSVFCFELELKKADRKITVDLPDEEPDYSLLGKKSVLLVEDNKVNQNLASIILKQMGMQVFLANNGYEAIEMLLDDDCFDIILMDLQMPGIDGLAATQMIRNKMKVRTPIIALTANAIIGDREKCIAAGMNDYVSKPFAKRELAVKMINSIKIYSGKETTGVAREAFYDLDKLRAQTGNDETFIKGMLELFCELVTETIENIDIALSDKNYELIKEYAHKVKASIDALEIKELRAKVRELENAQEFDEDFLKNVKAFKNNLKYMQLILRKNELSIRV